MEKMTEFGETLYKQLKAAGYSSLLPEHIGLIDLADYEGMSGRQLTEIYVQKHNLDEKVFLLKVITDVYNLRYQDKRKLGLVSLFKGHTYDYTSYLYLFRFGDTNLRMKGDLSNIRYTWKKDTYPTLNDAIQLYNQYREMKKYKLKHVNETFCQITSLTEETEIFPELPEPETGKYINVLYAIRKIKNSMKIYARKKDLLLRKKTKTFFDKELSRKKMEEPRPENKEEQKIVSIEKTVERTKNNLSIIEGQTTKGFLFLMNKKITLYQSFIESMQEFNHELENFTMELINKTPGSHDN